MRIIEKQMNKALRSQSDFKKDNTRVETTSNGIESRVFLHDNLIAVINHPDQKLTIFDGGWQSNTTKSRLNALLNEFHPNFGVVQKNFEWFLYYRHSYENFKDYTLSPFVSGTTI